MEKRREVRQLGIGDIAELTLVVKVELTSAAEPIGDGTRAILEVKPLPCGASCGNGCDCQFAMFDSLSRPVRVTFKGTARVPFLGNLEELLAERKETEARIALIEASRANRERGSAGGGDANGPGGGHVS